MDAPLQRRVQRYGWDRAAPVYERFWSRQLRPAQDALMRMADLQGGQLVLDVACGTGLVTFRAAEAVGPTGSVVGTDISEGMVAGAREEAAGRGLPVSFERMDAESLTFHDGSFDVALCALGLMYVPDPSAAMASMTRVVRPGGTVVAAVWGPRRECGWAEVFPIVERRVASDVCPLFFQLGNGDSLVALFANAGVTNIAVERVMTELVYATDDEAVGAAFVGGPVALAYSRFDEADRAEAHAEYLESIAPFRRDDGYAIPGTFIVARGSVVTATQ